MRFSIVTIAYNAEKYIADTLASVSQQQFFDYEHLVWDGGSTDGTLKIVSQFPHACLLQGKDAGISDAMNKAAAHAKGEFLIHLHADDCLAHPKVLALIDSCLKQHPSIEWLYGQADIIDEKGIKKRTQPFHTFDAKRLRKYNILTHPATVISRELFMRSEGFDTSLRYCMDYDLWLRFAKWRPAFALPAVLACFREHEQSLSTREKLAVANEAYAVRNRYVQSVWERWRSYRTWKRRIKK